MHYLLEQKEWKESMDVNILSVGNEALLSLQEMMKPLVQVLLFSFGLQIGLLIAVLGVLIWKR